MPPKTNPHAERLSLGIYSFPAAADLLSRGDLPVKVGTVRYWLKTGLAPSSFGRGREGSFLLSFLDVVSLEVVKLFRHRGISLQAVRKLEHRLRDLYPDMDRPFASEVFFTDGSAVWHSQNPADERVIEIIGKRPDQVAWTPVIQAFANEISYEEGVAAAWRLGKWVVADPRIQFGTPVVAGTRIPVTAIRQELSSASAEEVAGWHNLDVEQVREVEELFAA